MHNSYPPNKDKKLKSVFKLQNKRYYQAASTIKSQQTTVATFNIMRHFQPLKNKNKKVNYFTHDYVQSNDIQNPILTSLIIKVNS